MTSSKIIERNIDAASIDRAKLLNHFLFIGDHRSLGDFHFKAVWLQSGLGQRAFNCRQNVACPEIDR